MHESDREGALARFVFSSLLITILGLLTWAGLCPARTPDRQAPVPYGTPLYDCLIDPDHKLATSITFTVRAADLGSCERRFFTPGELRPILLEYADYAGALQWDCGHLREKSISCGHPQQHWVDCTANCVPMHFRLNRGPYAQLTARIAQLARETDQVRVSIAVALRPARGELPQADEVHGMPDLFLVRVCCPGTEEWYRFPNRDPEGRSLAKFRIPSPSKEAR